MDDFHDLGLKADLAMWTRTPLDRRHILQLGLVGIGTLLTACSTSQGQTNNDGCVSEIPEETAGPFPGDGSQQNLNV